MLLIGPIRDGDFYLDSWVKHTSLWIFKIIFVLLLHRMENWGGERCTKSSHAAADIAQHFGPQAMDVLVDAYLKGRNAYALWNM